MNYILYEGFQDEFRVIGIYESKREALKAAKKRPGWNKSSPTLPSVWIRAHKGSESGD
jgi:hypothetical protein